MELLIVIAIIGLLAAIVIPNLLNAVQRGKQKRTMADMRSLASAIEAYAVDHNAYPSASCASGLYLVLGKPLNQNSFSDLTPTYIAEPPWRDGWGHPFVYGHDTDNYNIVSLGRDRKPNTLTCGTTTDFNDDIIYSNGTFVQWPEGTQH